MAFNGVVREKGSWIVTDNEDNDTSTATKAAPASGQTHWVTSVAGGYDATVSGNTLILKDGTTEVGRWYVYDSFALVFPSPVQINGAANLELEASGAGGTTGAATMTGYTL
jgi:hypothetical protein